jgi:hypothetical protein
MSVRVEVSEVEDIRVAIRKLQQLTCNKFSRAWYKSRIGYYEKPSVLGRRKKLLRKRNLRLLELGGSTVKMRHGLTTIHKREGGFP